MIKRILRYTLYLLCGFIDFILVYATLAVTLPYIRTSGRQTTAEKNITIYVQSNGVHTDFVLPVKTAQRNWNEWLHCSDFKQADTSFRYVSIGWGDKGFFIATPTWADLKASTVFNAAFGLSSTAMHVTYRRSAPHTGASCKRLVLSEEQYERLLNYITGSFRETKKGFLLVDHPGYTGFDRFYEAKGTYSLLKTCNVWTGQGLEVTGLRTGIWTPFAYGVLQNLN